MGITTHENLLQGSDEWLAARLGLITASEMKLLVTPTLKIADNEKTRAHIYELAAQRISQYVEPTYVGDDMLRGMDDEIEARAIYSANVAALQTVGFITNDKWGFTLGYSPDALVGDNGLIEIKSRRQGLQVKSMVECFSGGTIPAEYMLQVQTGLLVSERDWLDFVSYSGGLHMAVVRVWPDDAIQSAILEACEAAEEKIADAIAQYHATVAASGFVPTERKERQEMYV